MNTEWCHVCDNDFDPEEDDGEMVTTWKRTWDCPEEKEYMCSECVEKAIDDYYSREAAMEDHFRAKARGEI